MTGDWVITFTFDADPPMETMDEWETKLEGFDASVARIPDRGVDLTVFIPGELGVLEAINKVVGEVAHVVQMPEPIGLEVTTELEWQRRAEAPTMPELMSAAEIADELGISRQRVHQLRDTAAFPAPLADLRGGAVWDAAAVRRFNREWERKPGRPPSNTRHVVPNPSGGWDIRKPGASRTSAHTATRSEAVNRAREIVASTGGGELHIHGRKGELRVADSVAPTRDTTHLRGADSA